MMFIEKVAQRNIDIGGQNVVHEPVLFHFQLFFSGRHLSLKTFKVYFNVYLSQSFYVYFFQSFSDFLPERVFCP